jgi:succinate dehydrogenase / fumarate reductase cytochrome b subunit
MLQMNGREPIVGRRMTWLLRFWRSSIGGKVTMAVTGLLLFAFTVAHLSGNLLLLGGPAAINAYAKWLADLGALLWVARIGLLLVFGLHVLTAIRLARGNRGARPVAYVRPDTVQASMASRSMVFSGLTLLVFVVYHLLHFTFGVTNPTHYEQKLAGAGGHDVHAMVTASFSVPGVAIAYGAFQVVLFLHLSHGVQSMAQTIGIHHARYTPMIKALSLVLAAAVAGGNLLLATSVLTGLVEVPA